MNALPNKWTAFWLSLFLPGAGQAAARSWSTLLWVAAGTGWAFVLATRNRHGVDSLDIVRVAGLALIGLLSAEHAKRLREAGTRQTNRRSSCVRRRLTSQSSLGRNLEVTMTLDFALPAAELWSMVADLPRFLTIDPFHDRVTLQRTPAAPGVDLVLSHNAFGFRFLRFGKILAWRPGCGYTFSDLSPRVKQGFPHVFIVDIRPGVAWSENESTLTICVRGRWTSRIVPALIGRLWVTWVCREHARLLAKGL